MALNPMAPPFEPEEAKQQQLLRTIVAAAELVVEQQQPTESTNVIGNKSNNNATTLQQSSPPHNKSICRKSGFSVGPREKEKDTASRERPFSVDRGIYLRQKVSTDI